MKGCGEDRRKRWSQIRNVLDWYLFKPCLCEGLPDLSWKEVSLASLLFRPFKVYLEIKKWKLVKANLLGMTACKCCSSILTSSLIFSKPAQFFSTSLIFVNQLLINCLKKGFFFLGWGWKIWAWLFEGGSEKKSDARWKRRRTKGWNFSCNLSSTHLLLVFYPTLPPHRIFHLPTLTYLPLHLYTIYLFTLILFMPGFEPPACCHPFSPLDHGRIRWRATDICWPYK